jgi:site-specific DNA-cytosine methylase
MKNGTRKDNDTSIPLQAQIEVRADDISNCLTTVQKDSIVVKDKRWRKLTPLECERLQTVPDNYTAGVSNTQRFRMLGNGWTVDIISHILKGI